MVVIVAQLAPNCLHRSEMLKTKTKTNCFSTSFCTKTSSWGFSEQERRRKKKKEKKSSMISPIMFLSWNKVNLLQTAGKLLAGIASVVKPAARSLLWSTGWRSENLWLQNFNMMHGAVHEKTGFFLFGFLSVMLTDGFQILFHLLPKKSIKKINKTTTTTQQQQQKPNNSIHSSYVKSTHPSRYQSKQAVFTESEQGAQTDMVT